SAQSGGRHPESAAARGNSHDPEWAVWGAECGVEVRGRRPIEPHLYALHSALPTPHLGCHHPHSTLPPLTFTISPVKCRARSEHRNTIGPAQSSAVATRPRGMVRSI